MDTYALAGLVGWTKGFRWHAFKSGDLARVVCELTEHRPEGRVIETGCVGVCSACGKELTA